MKSVQFPTKWHVQWDVERNLCEKQTKNNNKQTVSYRHILQGVNFTRKSLLEEVSMSNIFTFTQLFYSQNSE